VHGNLFARNPSQHYLMSEDYKSTHVHRMDADLVVEEYRKKGYKLKEQTKPTIIAQKGFVRLVFVPADNQEQSQKT